MNDDLMRRISAAMDSDEGLAGDPEVTKAVAEDPDAARYARELARLQRWMASWPLETPSEDELEALAKSVEARLDERPEGDLTAAPVFDDEGEAPARSEGSVVEISLSAITELPDAFAAPEESSATLARLTLKKAPKTSLTEVKVARVDPRSAEHEEPSSSDETERPHLPPPVPQEPAHPTHATPPTPPTKRMGKDGRPAPTPSVREAAKVAASPATGATADAPAKVSQPIEGRVSFPMPAPAAPRLSLLEGNAPTPPPATDHPKRISRSRGWLPALLAAAAIGVGVIGTATLFSTGRDDPPSSAPATATMAPAARLEEPSAPAPAMAAAPAPPSGGGLGLQDRMPPAPEPPASPAESAIGGGAFDARDDAMMAGATSAGPTRRGDGDGARLRARRALASEAPAGAGDERTARGATGGGGTAPGASASMGASSGASSARSSGPSIGAQRPTVSGAPAAAAAAPPSSAGATLDRATVQAVMQGVEPAIRACAGERRGTAQIDVVVHGASGRVVSATVTGSFQGSPEGSCMARAVRAARFPTFTGEPLRFRYPVGI